MRKNAKVDIKDPDIAEILHKADPKIKPFSEPKKYEPWNKQPSNPIIKIKSKGKGTAYKDELIKVLREEIKKLKHQKINRISMNVSREKKKIIRKQKAVAVQKGKKIGHLLGNKIANDRIDKTVASGDRIKAVIAFPVIFLYAKEIGVLPRSYCILVLLNVFGEMRIKEFLKFGYRIETTKAALQELINIGLAAAFGEGFEQGKWSTIIYKSTLKGTKIFTDYKKFYEKKTKELLQSDEYKKQAYNW